ncbi:NAD-binding protein [Chloroflexota bacterium]
MLYCGIVGSGNICKVAHNVASMISMQAIAEALTMGVKAGVEAEVLWDAMRKGAFGRNNALHRRIPECVFMNDWDKPRFALALSTKDVRLATEVGRENNVPMPLANMLEQLMTECLNRGWGVKDTPIIVKLQEEAAGVELRAPNVDLEKAGKYVVFDPEALK